MNYTIRKIEIKDTQAIIEIDGIHSGEKKLDYWEKRIKHFVDEQENLTLGFVAEDENKIIGFILAEGRAWEFGSPLCGWIFGIGVLPEYQRSGIAVELCKQVCTKFNSLGISTIRTMVKKDDLNVLSFFRSVGFKAGTFFELELEI